MSDAEYWRNLQDRAPHNNSTTHAIVSWPDQPDVHAEGRRLVAGIIRRKQETEAWAQWAQDQRASEEWRRANPPLLDSRPARIEWP